MQFQYFPYQLQFKHPFKIAHTLRTHTSVVYLKLIEGNIEAWGEAAFPPYVTENKDTFLKFIDAVKLPNTVTDLQNLHQYLQNVFLEFPNDIFSICALDIALHNLLATKLNTSVKTLYNIPNVTKSTSITIGICDKEEMVKKIEEAKDAEYFKLKVNEAEAFTIVKNFRNITNKPFVVDANQGFTTKAIALKFAHFLQELNVDYLEQPFNKLDLDTHKWLKQNCSIPLIADESFQRLADLDKVAQCFSGINVKLMKSGGIMEGQMSLQKAKSMGLITMLGCMSESSVAVNAANELVALADFVDLDGPFLIQNDPFQLDVHQNKLYPNFL